MSGVRFPQLCPCVKALWKALSPYRICPSNTNGYQMERKLVLCEWLQLQKNALHSPQRNETVIEWVPIRSCNSYRVLWTYCGYLGTVSLKIKHLGGQMASKLAYFVLEKELRNFDSEMIPCWAINLHWVYCIANKDSWVQFHDENLSTWVWKRKL